MISNWVAKHDDNLFVASEYWRQTATFQATRSDSKYARAFFQFLYFVHIWLCLLPYLVVRLTISAAPHDDGGMDIFSKVWAP